MLDLLEGRPIYTLKGHCGAVTAIKFSPTGEFFASGGCDQQLLIWKTNFDNDDVTKIVKRSLYSPGVKSKSKSSKESPSSRSKEPQEINNEDDPEDNTNKNQKTDEEIADKLEVNFLF